MKHALRWQFSLRALLSLATAATVWLGIQAEQIHRQRIAVRTVERLGGQVVFPVSAAETPVRYWFSQWLGAECASNADAVLLGGANLADGDLTCLNGVPHIRTLVLTSTPITDAAVAHLQLLDRLEHLDLRFTRITQSGVDRLRRRLPHAKILFRSDID